MLKNVKFPSVAAVSALEVLDSRGNPTVKVALMLDDGSCGEATAPSGASTGKYEMYEKRDGGARYRGRGVAGAVASVNETIGGVICREKLNGQRGLDRLLRELDGTDNMENLGANAILPVSIAYARACAKHYALPLYRYLGGVIGEYAAMPCPMMNVLNGGAHSKNNIDIQEFMIVPVGISDHGERIHACAEIYAELGEILSAKGHVTAVGDEGGYAPMLERDEEAFDLLYAAITEAGYGDSVCLAVDAAASEWWEDGAYLLPKRCQRYGTDELISYWQSLCRKYPIISIEDGLGEDDGDGWRCLTRELGSKVMLVGDDLFVTNKRRVSDGVRDGQGNALLIKPNQAGTVTDTIEAALTARGAGYELVASHRSGETCDTFISDLAVALGAGFIKAGAPCRGERIAKYNRLFEIGDDRGDYPDGNCTKDACRIIF